MATAEEAGDQVAAGQAQNDASKQRISNPSWSIT